MRVWWSLLLLGALTPGIEEEEEQQARLLVDFWATGAAEVWIAAALERNVYRDLTGFDRLLPVEKTTIDTRACDLEDSECRQAAYSAAGIDIIMLGGLSDNRLDYEVYETWTGGLVSTGSYELGDDANPVRIRLETMGALNPVLRRGGLLEQRRFFRSRAQQEDEGAKEETGLAAYLVPASIGFLILLLASPLLLVWRLVGRQTLKDRARSGTRWLSAVLIFGLALFLVGYMTPYRNQVETAVTAWLASYRDTELLVSLAGGILWGAFCLLNLRLILPRLSGMERIRHNAIWPLLRAWLVNTVLRSVLFAVYLPFAIPVWLLCAHWGVSEHHILALALPTTGLAVYFWLLSLVDNLALYLDERLVDGPAGPENPWHLGTKRYFLGYLRRSGLAISKSLLDRTLLLPCEGERMMTYGGGLSRPRILIPDDFLETALGAIEERHEPQAQTANLAAFGLGLILPQQKSRPSARKRRLGLRHMAQREQKDRVLASRLRVVRRPIGESATLLGYVLPAPSDQTVGLISDSREDYGVVKELLTHHYAAFEKQLYDEEYDDTDPTQKDFLFGGLLHQIGGIIRGESLFNTLLLCAQLWLLRLPRLLQRLIGIPGSLYRRTMSRYAAVLADAWVALNLGGDHLIQYLYFQKTRSEDHLTARADATQLLSTSRLVFKAATKHEASGEDRHLMRATIRNRLLWLSQLFYLPVARRGGLWLRILSTSVVVLAVAGVGYWAVRDAVRYHPVYTQRMIELAEKIAEAQKEAEGNDAR